MKKLLYLLLPVALTGLFSSAIAQENYNAYSRLDYYTNEPTAEMVVEAPADRAGKKIYFDLVLDQQILVRTYPGMPGRFNTIPFPTEKLHEGSNEVTVSFYENGQWMDSRKVPVIIREKRFYAVKTDRLTGALVSDGLPLFPLVMNSPISDCDEERLMEVRENGFNAIGVSWDLEGTKLKDRRSWLDLCAKYNMKVVYQLDPVIESGLDHDKMQGLLEEEVEAMKDNPALLAWQISALNVPGDDPSKFHRGIHEIDPYHPVILDSREDRMDTSWLEAADIFMLHPFVSSGTIGEEARLAASLIGKYGYEKPVWIAVNERIDGMPDPYSTLLKASVAMVSETSGIAGLATDSRAGWPWYISEILPQRLAGNPLKVSSFNEKITASAWSGRGGIAVVASNLSYEQEQLELYVEGLEGTFPAEKIFRNEPLQTVDGVLRASVGPLESAYYRIIQKEDVHFRDPLRKKNILSHPGFEVVAADGEVQGCECVGSHCYPELRLVSGGMHSLAVFVPEDSEGSEVIFGLKEEPSKQIYSLSVWARLKPSTANYHLEKGWFGKREWSETKPEPSFFTMGFSPGKEQTFELTSSWKKYEMSIDLRDAGTADHKPYIKILSSGEFLFDEMMFIPSGATGSSH